MKTKIYASLLLMFVILAASGQICLKMKQGQHIKMAGFRYDNDEVFTPSWARMSESKKDKKVAEFNAKVASGEIKPKGSTYDYELKNISVAPGIERALVVTEISGKKYEALIACINDTMYFTRMVGVSYSIDSNGDTLGIGILGVQVVPNTLKVGDVLKPYEDIGVVFPKTISYSARHSILKGYETSVRSYRDVGYDSNTGWGLGTTTKTETKAIYETIDVKVRETAQFSSTSMNYAIAVVAAEEEVMVDGIKYKAYRIESETWIKPNVTKSYEATSSEWKQGKEASDANIKALMDSRGIKKGYLNPQGYTVSYRTERFVPGLGIAKLNIYDNFGNIMAGGALESIK